MNPCQKMILVVGAVLILLMLLFQPFQMQIGDKLTFNMGYRFILDPPVYKGFPANVNAVPLLVQWIGVIVLTGLAFLLSKSATVQQQQVSSDQRPVLSPPRGDSNAAIGQRLVPEEDVVDLKDDALTPQFVEHFQAVASSEVEKPSGEQDRSPEDTCANREDPVPNACTGTPSFHDGVSSPEKHPGIGRLPYAVGMIIILIIRAVLGDASAVLGLLLALLLAFPLVVSRLRNIGMSGTCSLLLLVPVANLFVAVRCLVCPEGFGKTGRIDAAGKVIVCVTFGFCVLVALGVLVAYSSDEPPIRTVQSVPIETPARRDSGMSSTTFVLPLTMSDEERGEIEENLRSTGDDFVLISDIPIPETNQSIRMVAILGGTFQMGSPSSEANRDDDEGPVHSVTVSSFWMGETEVTQGQWKAVMRNNPSHFKSGDNYPVEEVSWNDCQEFMRALNNKVSGWTFRLPTEAEWEYACRAGSQSRFCFGDSDSGLGEYAWYSGNSGGKTHPVKTKRANAFGLYDMHGNVWEWCQDWYHDNYSGAPSDGRAWESPATTVRVLRGGGWFSLASSCRSALRYGHSPGFTYNGGHGFRVARTQ